MSRALPEWISRNDDTPVPPRVRLRVYDRFGSICHICELPIKTSETWHADHVKALIEGGQNRESNLAPAHAHCNLAKANGEKSRKAKVQRTRQKHTGAIRPKGQIKSRGFEKRERTPSHPCHPSRFMNRRKREDDRPS